MFKKDGSVHHEGIENEKNTIEILNKLNIYKDNVEKRGGTKNKEDAVSGHKKISIKRKKSLKIGSFDWCDLANCSDILGDRFDSFLENVKELRSLPKSILEDPTIKSQVENKFNSICESCLNDFTSEDLRTILQRAMQDTLSGFDIVVNDVQTKSIFLFPYENHPVNQYLNSNYRMTLRGKAKKSRTVIFSDGINDYNSGIRVRVVSNNGISAFLGISEKNSNSKVVIKIQQDNIKKLISVTEHQKYDY